VTARPFGAPTGCTVTIAHRTARRPLFRIARPRHGWNDGDARLRRPRPRSATRSGSSLRRAHPFGPRWWHGVSPLPGTHQLQDAGRIMSDRIFLVTGNPLLFWFVRFRVPLSCLVQSFLDGSDQCSAGKAD
jgi:hypothetical protein